MKDFSEKNLRGKLFLKRIRNIGVLLIVAYLVSMHCVCIVSACDIDCNQSTSCTFGEKEYKQINEALNYLGYDSDDNVYCTEFLSLKDDKNEEINICFIYGEESSIGEYIVDDENHSCFIFDSDEDLYDILTSNDKIAVQCYGDNISIYTDSDDYVIAGEKDSNNKYDYKSLHKIEKFNFDVSEENIDENVTIVSPNSQEKELITSGTAIYITNSSYVGYFTEVGFVSNTTSPTGEGLCWAASGASIINYIKKTNYTAMSLYENVRQNCGGYPIGTVAYEKAMFDINNVSYTYKAGKLTYSNVVSTLKKGSPIMSCFSVLGSAHAVVLCGVFNISDSYGYIYMDPNVSGKYVLNYVDYGLATSSSNKFYYYNGQKFYDEWTKSFYNFK